MPENGFESFESYPVILLIWETKRRWAAVNQQPGRTVASSYEELILVVEESVPEEKQIYCLLELFKRLASRDSRSS
jgi:hypothetical protein